MNVYGYTALLQWPDGAIEIRRAGSDKDEVMEGVEFLHQQGFLVEEWTTTEEAIINGEDK